MRAQYAGHCRLCGKPIRPGDEIKRVWIGGTDDGRLSWVHSEHEGVSSGRRRAGETPVLIHVGRGSRSKHLAMYPSSSHHFVKTACGKTGMVARGPVWENKAFDLDWCKQCLKRTKPDQPDRHSPIG